MDYQERAISKLIERVSTLRERSRYSGLQRRNKVVDMYGVSYTAQGDQNTPAEIRISVSPDMIYYERFEFKLIISPFIIPIDSGGTGPATVTVSIPEQDTSDRSLSVSNNNITPNPHNHNVPGQNVTSSAHSHNVNSGVTTSPSATGGYRVLIEGIDVTAELMLQMGGNWITGEGTYPSADLKNFDIIMACGHLTETQRETILRPGYKKVEIKANGPFQVELHNYLKYNHLNR